MCTLKNEVNILIKNVIDVVLGGMLFWCFGYGIVSGKYEPISNPFFGFGNFFFSPDVNEYGTGEAYLRFFFHIALVTCSTTIFTGAVAERYLKCKDTSVL